MFFSHILICVKKKVPFPSTLLLPLLLYCYEAHQSYLQTSLQRNLIKAQKEEIDFTVSCSRRNSEWLPLNGHIVCLSLYWYQHKSFETENLSRCKFSEN